MSVLIKYWINIVLLDFYWVYHANFDVSLARNNMTIQLCLWLIGIIVGIASSKKTHYVNPHFDIAQCLLLTIEKINVLWTINKWKPIFYICHKFQWMWIWIWLRSLRLTTSDIWKYVLFFARVKSNRMITWQTFTWSHHKRNWAKALRRKRTNTLAFCGVVNGYNQNKYKQKSFWMNGWVGSIMRCYNNIVVVKL